MFNFKNVILTKIILCLLLINYGISQTPVELNSRIVSQISSPSKNIRDLAWDGAYLWAVDDSLDKIFEIDSQSGSVISVISSPCTKPHGLAFDSTGIWILDDSLKMLVKLDINSYAIVDSFKISNGISCVLEGKPYNGLAYDGEHLWTSYQAGWSSRTLRINLHTKYVDTCFYNYSIGLAYDTQYLWSVKQNGSYQGTLEKFEVPSGEEVSFAKIQNIFPVGLCYTGSNFWIYDSQKDSLYQIEIYTTTIDDRETPGIIKDFTLQQNYPNPFNSTSTIEFTISRSSNIDLSVYDVTGQKVKTLVNGKIKDGKFSFIWDASDLSTGIYLIRMTNGIYIKTRKAVLLK